MEDGPEAPATARRRARIVNAHGLHMRPSNKFVALASQYRADVSVDCQGTRADGKSILDMTCLAAECGATLDLEATGPDADAALDALAELIAAGFYMDEETTGAGEKRRD